MWLSSSTTTTTTSTSSSTCSSTTTIIINNTQHPHSLVNNWNSYVNSTALTCCTTKPIIEISHSIRYQYKVYQDNRKKCVTSFEQEIFCTVQQIKYGRFVLKQVANKSRWKALNYTISPVFTSLLLSLLSCRPLPSPLSTSPPLLPPKALSLLFTSSPSLLIFRYFYSRHLPPLTSSLLFTWVVWPSRDSLSSTLS